MVTKWAAALGCTISLSLYVCAEMHGQTVTFTGASGNNVWTNDANWQGGSAPGTNVGGSLFILSGNVEGGSPAIPVTGIDLDYTNIDTINFLSGGVTNNYDLQGTGSFTLNDDGEIVNNKTFSNTISVDVIGTGDTLTLNSEASSISLAGGVDLSDTGGVNLIMTGNSIVAVSGVISGTGGSVTVNTSTASGQGANLFGTNTYTGGTTLGGNVNINNNSSFGTGTISVIDDTNLSNLAGAALTLSNDINITLGSTLTYDDSDDLTLNGVISGTDTFAKAGSSALTLNGANTISGNFNFSGGTVVAGNDDAFGTAAVNVTGSSSLQSDNDLRSLSNNIAISSGQTLTYNGSNSLALSGVISGSGGITMNTSSTLTLLGDNTFTGGITYGSGTILARNDNALGTGSLTLSSNGTLQSDSDSRTLSNNVVLGSNALTFSGTQGITLGGIISGTGSIVRTASGDLTLNGANTFSGGITNAQGILTVGDDAALGTGALSVTGSSTLQAGSSGIALSNATSVASGQVLTISGSNDLTMSGVVSGAGALTKSGASGVTLSGTNTYSGGTTLAAGTITLGADGALGSGALTTSGDASIQSNDDSRAVSNNMTLGGGTTLTVGGSNNLTLSGVLSSTGALTKSGAGILTLSGTNTYTGATTVSAGTLLLTGSTSGSAFTVASGATLAGTGTITGNVNNSGTISPGTSPGTLNVVGDLTLTSSSIYDIEIVDAGTAGTDYDTIDVTGGATVAGTAAVTADSGYEPDVGDTFTVIQTTTGVTGTFDSITDNLPAMFSFTQSISGNDLVLTVVGQPLGSTVTARNLVFAAEAFERIRNDSPTGDIATVIDQLETLTNTQLIVAFEQIVPNYLVTQAEATFKGIDVQNNNINGRLNELRYGVPGGMRNNLQIETPQQTSIDPEEEMRYALLLQVAEESLEQQQETFRFGGAEQGVWGAWVSGFGTFGDFDAASSQAGFEFNTGGITLGFDYRIFDTLAAGAYAGWSNTGTTVDGGQGTNSFNSVNTGMYMTWFNEEGFYASGLVGGGVNFYENNRRIVFGTIDRVAESDPTGFYFQTLATGGYEFKFKDFAIGPQLALQYVNLQIGSHNETGADSLNLNVGAFNGNSFVTRLGFRSSFEFETSNMKFVPEVVGSWQHEYLSPIDTVDVNVPAGGQTFTYTGIGESRDSGLFGVNLIGISNRDGWSFTLQYNVEFIPNEFVVNNVYAGMRFTF
ncbi:autotransporter domain-containing protein [Poriferisphaera sp. WC338]|uniref:autotransporter domain-containing protein n=1 Tax=Poriferisphaera sp. WC338 TaxID=3425129 RepID=UPI003D819D83